MDGGELNSALLLVCSTCGRTANNFEVIVRREFVVWPVPKGFRAPKRAKKRIKIVEVEAEPDVYSVNLPLRVKRELLRNLSILGK